MGEGGPRPAVFLWSGGKDGAAALAEVREAGRYEVLSLVTTITEGYDRISVHGVRVALLERQAGALGLPVRTVGIPKTCTNEEYESRMLGALSAYRARGAGHAIAGDIFLGDVRAYRESLFARAGLEGVFPLWGRDTSALARGVIDAGFRAVATCVDARVLGEGFAGRGFDLEFLASLPPTADPCGENGEFHTFVCDGPGFGRRVPFELGDVVLRDGRFYYADLIPVAPTVYERDGHGLRDRGGTITRQDSGRATAHPPDHERGRDQ